MHTPTNFGSIGRRTPPFTFLFLQKDLIGLCLILFCPHADAVFDRYAPDGAARYFALRQKPEVADGLWPCEARRLRIADQQDFLPLGPNTGP